MIETENLVCRHANVSETALHQYRTVTGNQQANRGEILKTLRGATLSPARVRGLYVYEYEWCRFILSRQNSRGKRRGAATFSCVKVEVAK